MGANVANAEPGLTEPAWEGNVIEYKTPISMKYVRVYTEGVTEPNRAWLMRSEDIEGMSDVEIQNKYALPNKPTNIVDVDVPEGTLMREGAAAGNKWGKGGGMQFKLMERLPKENFTNPRALRIIDLGFGNGTLHKGVDPATLPKTPIGRAPIAPADPPVGEEPVTLPEEPTTPIIEP